MSRIGNNPIIIPEGVSVEIQPNLFSVKGKLGELSQPYDLVSVEQTDNTLTVKRENESKPAKAKHGLYRALFFNMIEGVSKGWTKELELVGEIYNQAQKGMELFNNTETFGSPYGALMMAAAGKDRNRQSSKALFCKFIARSKFLFLRYLDNSGSITVPTAIPAIARFI